MKNKLTKKDWRDIAIVVVTLFVIAHLMWSVFTLLTYIATMLLCIALLPITKKKINRDNLLLSFMLSVPLWVCVNYIIAIAFFYFGS